MKSVKPLKWPSKPKCKHNILKKNCLDPVCGGGTAKCKLHGTSKGYCKDSLCNASQQLCKLHKIDKRYCRNKLCGGGSRSCKHKVDKSFCGVSECSGGNRLCIHSIDKRYCFLCGGKNVCTKCKINGVRKIGAECKTCTPSVNTRGRYKEARVCAKLESWAEEGHIPKYTTWGKMIPHTGKVACGRVFPDFTFEFPSKVIILEVDEHQHLSGNYNPRCEMVRLQDIVNSYGALPVHIIRYNTDFLKINGKRTYVSSEQRQQVLLKCLQKAISKQNWDHLITLEYVCYDCMICKNPQSSCQLHHSLEFNTMIEFAEFINEKTPI
jgi:hypothetical protein